jgi:hypothetical protein
VVLLLTGGDKSSQVKDIKTAKKILENIGWKPWLKKQRLSILRHT